MTSTNSVSGACSEKQTMKFSFVASFLGGLVFAPVWVLGLSPQLLSGSGDDTIKQMVQIVAIVMITVLSLCIPRVITAIRNRWGQISLSPEMVDGVDPAAVNLTLREALDAIPEGFVIYGADDRLVLCNAKFREHYGYSEEQSAPGVTQQQLGLIDESRGVRVAEEDDGSFMEQRLEYRSRFKGRQVLELPDGRMISTSDRPLARGGFVSIQSDITELKETQARLKKSEQLLLDAIEGLDEGFIFYDENDELVMANSTYKKMYPTQKEMQPGITFEEALRLSVYGGEVLAAIGREEQWIAERVKQHRRDRSSSEQMLSDRRWVLVSEHRTVDGGIVGIRTDITKLKESQARADSANRAKTSFLAHMSHELRTPMNSIIGYSDMIRQQVFGPIGNPKYAVYMDNIYNSGALLLALINDILDTSRVEIGQLEAFPERVDPHEVIASSIEMMMPKAVSKNIKLAVLPSAIQSRLYVDRRHLQQILINLIGNAIKFTSKGDGVTISLSELKPGGVKIKVEDSGCGIAADDVAKVFEPFSQVGDAFAKANEGTGLGLFLVKNLTELNGANVVLESKIDAGTSVTVMFPARCVVAV